MNLNFLKKYIGFAKKLKPQLTKEASDYIEQKWAYIRKIEKENKEIVKSMPISIRSLEALIRLSTAYAKMRLSRKVEIRDTVNAFFIFMHSFYNGY